MTTATDQFLMFAAVFALAYLAHRLKERFFPGVSAEESGYAPGSERIPLSAVLGAVAVIAIFIGLFGYGGSAVFLG